MPRHGVGAWRARAVASCAGTALLWAGVGVLTAGAEPAPLLERSSCDQPVTPYAAPPPPILSGGGAGVPIQMEIPPTVFVRLGSSGTVDEVMTNTGCAPRSTDRFLIERDGRGDGIVPAPLVAEVLAEPGSGDWRTPGAWHPASVG